jgi:hypothetical protein
VLGKAVYEALVCVHALASQGRFDLRADSERLAPLPHLVPLPRFCLFFLYRGTGQNLTFDGEERCYAGFQALAPWFEDGYGGKANLPMVDA